MGNRIKKSWEFVKTHFSIKTIFVLIILGFGTYWISKLLLNMKDEKSTDLLFRLIASWPVALAVIAIVAFYRFHSAIDSLIRRVIELDTKGVRFKDQLQEQTEISADTTKDMHKSSAELEKFQSEIARLQEERQNALNEITKLKAEHDRDEKNRKEVKLLEKEYDQVVDKLIETNTESQRLVKVAISLAQKWEFEYLFLFFVPMTNKMLRWLSDYNKSKYFMTREALPEFWPDIDSAQISIILDLLLKHKLINDENKELLVTETGKEYLTFLATKQQQSRPPIGPPPLYIRRRR